MKAYLFTLLVGVIAVSAIAQSTSFVSIQDGRLIKDEAPYYYIGTNLWFGMMLGSEGEGGDRERLIRELDRLQELGVNNLRIMVGSEGPEDEPWRVQPALQNKPKRFNKDLLNGLDFLLIEMKKRDMTGVLVLNNFFQWTGGMAQYVSWATDEPIPYPHAEGSDWNDFQRYSATFFSNEKAQKYFKRFIRKIVKRKNKISKVKYKDDPTIMAWQLANEPRGFGQGIHYLRWVDETAAYIKQYDKNHLVSLGGEGKTSSDYAGTDFENVSKSVHLDYLTAHLWIENWSWYKPHEPATFETALKNALAYIDEHVAIAAQMNKPIVFEEFGVSRDSLNYHPEAQTTYRDRFYQALFDSFYAYSLKESHWMGCNFWSWAGEGLPDEPEGFWKRGHTYTGDPPHELQGWYSVYAHDKSTLEIIKQYNQKIKTKTQVGKAQSAGSN